MRASGGAAGRTGGAKEQDAETLRAMSDMPQRFTAWPQFVATYGDLAPFGFLSYAVRGFFENEGTLCYVQLISMTLAIHPSSGAVRAGLAIAGGLR